MIESLTTAGLPVLAFPPSACAWTAGGEIINWDLTPLRAALQAGLVPVVNGDVVFDARLGGTILSTEDVFVHLARSLRPQRILLAGSEAGVWEDFPARARLIPRLAAGSPPQAGTGLQGSAHTDVTGGMAQKVTAMLSLARELPGLEVLIFSGLEPGLLQQALSGSSPGTSITA